MPRVERPLELNGSALSEFAEHLRKLRAQAGRPPYRELARRAHYSSTTLSDAAGGRRLPSLEVTLAYVRACGGDRGEWEKRWRTVAVELSSSTVEATRDDRPAPYVGLRAFGAEDADWFFGRERLVDELRRQVAARRLVVVAGPSGCGKSSILQAGLAPKLAGPVLLFTPGVRPLRECSLRIAALTDGVAEAVVIVDQFEELFTRCGDDRERSQFLAVLHAAISRERSRCRVVLGIRADFISRCTRSPELAEAVQNALIDVDVMTPEELRQAISQPALRARCVIENALLATLVALAHGQEGALPLLSHALSETWRRRKGNTLTLAGFEAAGGFDGILASTAESVFATLDEARQAVARDLFRRLTELGEGAKDGKRRISAEELDDTPIVAAVTGRFTQARVLVNGRGTIELAHEKLITAWPRMATWLTEDRGALRVHRELTNATAIWERHRRDLGVLLRGARLAAVREWADRSGDPNTKERVFLNASIAADERERQAKRRAAHRHRLLGLVVAILLAAAVLTTVYAA
ncbi:helix-turn-helix domain-containing protein [Amycolatopsis sp. lyj-108]|uniref:nSTAND1 domain-containing NTPase n=1 Tax=Amycolatopsis sp. lyj-108 TaxID=2789286 RepID=UPI00397ABA69